jgi:cytochrome c-type biogenesis protein CcmH/NrfG
MATDALQIAPFSAAPHYAMGLVLLREKDEEKAAAEFGRAVQLDPSWGALRLAHADALVKSSPDQLPTAITEYEAFLAISPGDSDANRVKNALKTLKKRVQ